MRSEVCLDRMLLLSLLPVGTPPLRRGAQSGVTEPADVEMGVDQE